MGTQLNLTRDLLGGLLKQGAVELRTVTQERDTLLKFATAVEILPQLEKIGAVHFPSNIPFAEKALRLTKRSSAEIEKLAYMAQHFPNIQEKEAQVANDFTADTSSGKVSKLTQFVLNGWR